MISFRPYGRAGNFFFMAANCISFALKHGLEFSMPKRTNDEFWNPIYLEHLQHPAYEQGREDILINEPHYHYAPHEWREEWRDKYVIFNGYYQSERYFLEHRAEILYLFNLPYELKPIVSIHARFGDYLTIEGKHIIMNEEYLTKAMKLMTQKTGLLTYKVFSDDLRYFKQNFGHIYDFEYSRNTGELTDLIEISCCHSNINSSSSFSWWGAWLNQNPDKVVITDKNWFQPNWMDMDTKDIIPSTFIKL